MIEAKNLSKSYKIGTHTLHALHDITFSIQQGKTLGIVGESGCGKSTLGKLLIGLETPTSGEVYVDGCNIFTVQNDEKKKLHRKMQMIFQDPYSSLNPRMTIGNCIGEGLDIHKIAFGEERRHIIEELLKDVGLPPSAYNRYPHEFSGGQRQRIVIARALAVDPSILVCDEAVSSLDACTEEEIIELLKKLKAEKNLTYLFISHNIHAVQKLADYIAVMYLGRIVEYAPCHSLLSSPQHPYTQALLSAIPIADPKKARHHKRIPLMGEPPSPIHPPTGCVFHPRCIHAFDKCPHIQPPEVITGSNHLVKCHLLF